MARISEKKRPPSVPVSRNKVRKRLRASVALPTLWVETGLAGILFFILSFLVVFFPEDWRSLITLLPLLFYYVFRHDIGSQEFKDLN